MVLLQSIHFPNVRAPPNGRNMDCKPLTLFLKQHTPTPCPYLQQNRVVWIRAMAFRDMIGLWVVTEDIDRHLQATKLDGHSQLAANNLNFSSNQLHCTTEVSDDARMYRRKQLRASQLRHSSQVSSQGCWNEEYLSRPLSNSWLNHVQSMQFWESTHP